MAYILCAATWGLACAIQQRRHESKNGFAFCVLNFAVNTAVFPLSVLAALYWSVTGKAILDFNEN